MLSGSAHVLLRRCLRNNVSGAARQLLACHQGVLPAAHAGGAEGRAWAGSLRVIQEAVLDDARLHLQLVGLGSVLQDGG